MSEDMLQNNEKMLQRNMIRVKLPAKLQAALDHLLHHELADVHQVAPLNQDRISL